MIQRNAGFSLAELVTATAILGLVTLLAAAVMINIGTANRGLSNQLASVELANALRTQLSRRVDCATNMVGRPGAYAGTSPVAVQLSAGGPVVQTGASLNSFRLEVRTLEMRNITASGTANGGNALYVGDLFLATQMQGDPNTTIQLRETAVARVTMEVQAGNLVACYGNDTEEDTTLQTSKLCGLVTSPTGVVGAWDGTRCRTPDAPPANTCAAMGGQYAGGCAFKSETYVISKTIPAGSPGGGVGYMLSCPGGTTTLAGACSGVGYYGTPFATILLYGPIGSQSGLFACAWLPGDYPGGNESVPYNLYAVCLK